MLSGSVVGSSPISEESPNAGTLSLVLAGRRLADAGAASFVVVVACCEEEGVRAKAGVTAKGSNVVLLEDAAPVV